MPSWQRGDTIASRGRAAKTPQTEHDAKAACETILLPFKSGTWLVPKNREIEINRIVSMQNAKNRIHKNSQAPDHSRKKSGKSKSTALYPCGIANEQDISTTDTMSQRAIDAVFTGLYQLTDIRAVLRRTAPLHQLNESEKESTKKAIEQVRKQLIILEEELT
ncbi:hypothetical protein McpCs1_01950 [Methanocorpusculaceae archaeon Cs1]|uniref:Uncharacterized protein n=2 Tax=Methanorbis rubei TaxID=3028300 RepID=A0AAE4MEW0_9EURY|nr:hypothetical protein [Methanocorpusculaceae archaeon Cs1]